MTEPSDKHSPLPDDNHTFGPTGHLLNRPMQSKRGRVVEPEQSNKRPTPREAMSDEDVRGVLPEAWMRCQYEAWLAIAASGPNTHRYAESYVGLKLCDALAAALDWQDRARRGADPYDSSAACIFCGYQDGVLVKPCPVHAQLAAEVEAMGAARMEITMLNAEVNALKAKRDTLKADLDTALETIREREEEEDAQVAPGHGHAEGGR